MLGYFRENSFLFWSPWLLRHFFIAHDHFSLSTWFHPTTQTRLTDPCSLMSPSTTHSSFAVHTQFLWAPIMFSCFLGIYVFSYFKDSYWAQHRLQMRNDSYMFCPLLKKVRNVFLGCFRCVHDPWKMAYIDVVYPCLSRNHCWNWKRIRKIPKGIWFGASTKS